MVRRLGVHRPLDLPQMTPKPGARLARYLTERLRLQNLAEDLYRVDRVKDHLRSRRPELHGSIDALVSRMASASLSPQSIPLPTGQLVLTSHPTESTRRTILQHIRRLSEILQDWPTGFTAEQLCFSRLKETVRVLWRTASQREQRPTIYDEIELGLWFIAETLWTELPKMTEALTSACQSFAVAPPEWQLGSWIGGDRDGHPGVTAAATLHALNRHLETAQTLYQRALESLEAVLSIEADRVSDMAGLTRWLDELGAAFPQMAAAARVKYPNEPLRQAVCLMQTRLAATPLTGTLDGGFPPCGAGYRDGEAFQRDVARLGHHWDTDPLCHPPELTRLTTQVDRFGFHLASLDIRQHSRVQRAALSEILGQDLEPLAPAERIVRIAGAFETPHHWEPANPFTRDLHDALNVYSSYRRRFGAQGLGRYLVSMAHDADDLIGALFLCRTVDPDLHLDVVPVFETLHDLQRAPGILDRLWEQPVWRTHVQARKNFQDIMLGFSDSTKDASTLTALWAIYRAEIALTAWGREHGVEIGLFHGRGGALGRGGGPTSRGILGRPPQSRHTHLSITQQGEVLSQKFLLPSVAHRSLELMMVAHLEASLFPSPPPDQETLECMDRLASRSHRVYRDLIDAEGFWEYFLAATPIREMTALNWGSRPAWREAFGWEDLRAIPWVFSWTQNRLLLPAWYGAGTALAEALEQPGGAELLQRLYRRWPFWTTLIHNLSLALLKADLSVAEAYQDLVPDGLRDQFWPRLVEEYRRLREAVTAITGQAELLADQPTLADVIRWRNPHIDPLNHLQVVWLARYRETEDPDWLPLIAETMTGIAMGLRNTG